MSEKITRLTSILLWVLMGLTVIFAILFYVGGVVPGTEGTRYQEPKVTNSFIVFSLSVNPVVAFNRSLAPFQQGKNIHSRCNAGICLF